MNDFLAIAVQNTIAAGGLAVVVYGVTRVCRRPPIAHVLWLVVLVKLIGPPIVPVAWLAPIVKNPAANKPVTEPLSVTREPASARMAFAPLGDPGANHGEPAPSPRAKRPPSRPRSGSTSPAAIGRRAPSSTWPPIISGSTGTSPKRASFSPGWRVLCSRIDRPVSRVPFRFDAPRHAPRPRAIAGAGRRAGPQAGPLPRSRPAAG